MSDKLLKGEKRKKEASSPLFGAPLEEAALRSDAKYAAVPSPIRNSVEYLNQRGSRIKPLSFSSLSGFWS